MAMRLKTRYLFGVLALLLGALIPSPAVAASTVTLVASGLDSCPAHVPANAPGPCAGGGKVLRINLRHEGARLQTSIFWGHHVHV